MGFWQNLNAITEYKGGVPYEPAFRYVGNSGQAARRSDFGDGAVAIEQGFERCTWVYRCIRRKMDMCARPPWMVRRYDTDGSFEDDRQHPAAFKLNFPTMRAWDRAYQMGRAAGFLSVTGNAFFGKFGPGSDRESPTAWRDSPGSELRLESSVGVEPIEDGMGWIDHYRIDGGASKSWDPATVIQVMLPSLSSPFWGMSELAALAMPVDTDVEGHRWNLNSLGAGGMPSWLMVDYTQTAQTLPAAQASIEDRFTATGRKRTPWVIPGATIVEGGAGGALRSAIELHKLGLSAQEMDWIEGSKMTRDEIFVGLGFHPADASNERATHDNARVAKRQAWEEAAMPLLTAFSSWFTLRMLTEEERLSGAVIMPDLSDIRELQESRESIAETFWNLTRGGLTVADAAKIVGIEVSELPEYERPKGQAARPAEQGDENETTDDSLPDD